VVTPVRTLLTPPPNREMRVKNEYIVHKSIQGCMGVKITANDLDHAVAGTSLYVVGPDDDVDELKVGSVGIAHLSEGAGWPSAWQPRLTRCG
jgi:translation initiation factor 5B